jgi:hypothetical protein
MMMICTFLLRAYERRNKVTHLRDLCTLTGQPCLVDPVTSSPAHCTRREFLTVYLDKHKEPLSTPPHFISSPVQHRLPFSASSKDP